MIAHTWIVRCLRDRSYFFSMHGDEERKQDNLTVREVKQALVAGRILEHYDDTGRGESCLVVGFTEAGKPVHVVCGKRRECLVIVTVYIPGPPKFRSPYIRGKS